MMYRKLSWMMMAAVLAAGAAVSQAASYVVGWGMDDEGETRVPLEALGEVQAIGAGWHHSLAVLAETGEVVAWGDDELGQTTVPWGARSGVAKVVAGEDYSLALKEDGSLVIWGNPSITNKIPEALKVAGATDIVAGQNHALALTPSGEVIAFGTNSLAAAVTNIPESAKSGVTGIAAGSTFSLALKGGAVFGWGSGDFGELEIPESAQSGVTAIAAGPYTCLALKGGRVIQWGWTKNGPEVPAEAQSGVTAIACGYCFSVALREDGKVVTWGDLDGSEGVQILDVPEWAKSGVAEIAVGYRHVLVRGANQPARITDSNVPFEAYPDKAYQGSVTAVGDPTATYHLGKHPDWLNLDPRTGTLTGVPTHLARATNFWVVASNRWGMDSNLFAVVVTNAPKEPPVFITEELSAGEVGVEYVAQVLASNSPVYSIDLALYPLPAGLEFGEDGWFRGVPTEEYAQLIEIKAENEAGAATQMFLLRIANPTEAPEFVTEGLPDATVGSRYSAQLEATHGAHFEASGRWPAGIEVAYGGEVGGVPAAGAGGAYQVSAVAYNVAGSVTQKFALTVMEAPGISGAPVPGVKGDPEGYRYEFTRTGWPLPTTSVSKGSLPPGLALSTDGVINGTPTATGTWNFTVRAANGVGADATLACTMTVGDSPVPPTPPVTVPPEFGAIRMSKGTLTLEWTDESGRAVLERAETLKGAPTWTVVPGASSPWTWSNAPAGPWYFRLEVK